MCCLQSRYYIYIYILRRWLDNTGGGHIIVVGGAGLDVGNPDGGRM